MGNPTYGQEWRSTDPEFVEEAKAFLRDGVKERYPGATIVKEVSIGGDEPAHWTLECEDTTVHSHFWLKWKTDDDQ